MPNDNLFVEIEHCQITKDKQYAAGDDFQCIKIEEENRNIAVLSDGLGSGIKAHLLANMTTTMALRYIQSNKPIIKLAETIMDSLPECEVRKISYATFTVVDMYATTGKTRVIEMGNPQYIQMRNNREVPPISTEQLISERWPDRVMAIHEIQMLPGDRLIFCSDGVTQAGLGNDAYKFGWRRKGLLEFTSNLITQDSDISAKDLSRTIPFYAISLNENNRCVDDTSCVVIYLRTPRRLRIMTGPPFRKEDDTKFARLAMPDTGADQLIICGGTTANIICRELHVTVDIDVQLIKRSGGLPPPAKIKNIGLTTEGILTLTKVAALLEGDSQETPAMAAREIINRIEDSDVIEFIVGTKVNEAHQDPTLPIDLEIRRNIIKRLQTVLEKKYRKKVKIKYY